MLAEIFFGYVTRSMALLADGFHMASHFGALSLSWVAYYYTRKHSENKNFKSGSQKILALSGYTSAIILLVIAVIMAYECVKRFIHPVEIKFGEAILVVSIGLIVNGMSAFILHHKEEHGDHNLRAAYLHVLADTLTSVTAIVALTAGMFWNFYSLDAVSGIFSSFIITKWALDLSRASGKELLDYSRE